MSVVARRTIGRSGAPTIAVDIRPAATAIHNTNPDFAGIYFPFMERACIWRMRVNGHSKRVGPVNSPRFSGKSLSRGGKANAVREMAFPVEEKRNAVWEITFPVEEKQNAVWEITFPAEEKQNAVREITFPWRKSKMQCGKSLFPRRKSKMQCGKSLFP